jgi:hypothetical protein
VTAPLRVTAVRRALLGATVAAALIASGCGSDDDKKDGKEGKNGGAQTTPKPTKPKPTKGASGARSG